MKKTLYKIWFLILGAAYSIPLCLAQQTSNRPTIIPPGTEGSLYIPTTPQNQVPEEYLQFTLLPSITSTIIAAAGACSVLFIIIGGIEMLTAYGNEEKVKKGLKTITYAIAGLLISILSYAIVSIISAINLK
jgi:hypothetical protein